MPLAPAGSNNNEPDSTGFTRAPPGSFSPVVSTPTIKTQSSTEPLQVRRVESSSEEDVEDNSQVPSIPVARRSQNALAQHPRIPYNTAHSNSSNSSLQNFSRPTVTQVRTGDLPLRNTSPLTPTPLTPSARTSFESTRGGNRKHSHSQGLFDPSLSTTSHLSPNTANPQGGMTPSNSNLSASQIAAQAAMQHQSQHARQRSQTLPMDNNNPPGPRRPPRGPASPPLLSLTEASGERGGGFGERLNGGFGSPLQSGQVYRNGLIGGNVSAAATAANVVFSRSPQSPILPPIEFPPAYRELEKPTKPEKTSKVKLFSRPAKIGIKDTKEKPLPSPIKFSSYTMSSLQRNNMSTASLVDNSMSGASSMYSMVNASSATIKPVDTPVEKEKEKEKKHHFLSRQKHKLTNKDDYGLPLSSAASNSRPADPSAPSSLYSFALPPSPGPTSTSFAKSMSGLDLRHGGRALRDRKKEERVGSESALRDGDSAYPGSSDWPGPSSLGSAGAPYFGAPSTGYAPSLYGTDPQELARFGLNNMTPDDAWPFLKAKLLIIFEGEDLRLPVEDFNRLVTTHIQRCIQKRAPNILVEDLRDLLTTGFSSLDQTLRRTPDDRLIPHLAEMWLFTFTSILPYMQAVFLPLDLEFSGHGPLLSSEQARDFWGALPLNTISGNNQNGITSTVPAGQLLEVRRIVLTAYRDTVILPRFDTLKTIFSRLSLESINSHLNQLHGTDHLSSSPDSFGNRPGTAMSLDPAHSSYNSQGTTLLGGGGSDPPGARSRAISNVSYGSDNVTAFPRFETTGPGNMPPPPSRPFTPSSSHPAMLGVPSSGLSAREREREQNLREQLANAEDSKLITETVGRMLQCVSVLTSVGIVPGAGGAGFGFTDEEKQKRMEELCQALKLNWLGRGRTGRNRRGFVGAKIKTDPPTGQAGCRL